MKISKDDGILIIIEGMPHYGLVTLSEDGYLMIRGNDKKAMEIHLSHSTCCEPPDEWLEQQFGLEYCYSCGGDAVDHDTVPQMCNWLARCKHPLPKLFTEEECSTEIAIRHKRKNAGLPLVPAGHLTNI
jgi:hypothetical protein